MGEKNEGDRERERERERELREKGKETPSVLKSQEQNRTERV